jgi:hypothetical protein
MTTTQIATTARANIVRTFKGKAPAHKMVTAYADVQGEQTYWTGSRHVNVLVEWFVQRHAGGYDVVQVITPR